MTEPTTQHGTDPITAILLAVTRIEGNLAGALDSLKRHDGQIADLTHTVGDHGNRLVAIETRFAGDDQHHNWSMTAKMIAWSAVAALCAVVGVLIALLVHR